jgi:hypothetical protein
MFAHIFKSASWDGNKLLVPSQTEIHVVDGRTFEIVETISHPWFNDVHHVARIGDALHVVSTGLDSLLVMEPGERVRHLRHALGDDPWAGRSAATDYRRVTSTKPHASHPNFVFETPEGRWLTRFEQRDAVCIDRDGLRISIDEGRPHDGVVVGDRLWFTTVNGFLVSAEARSGRIVERHDLNTWQGGESAPLGWCRGLHLDGDVAYVGFSRIRHTRFRQYLSWLKHRFDAQDGQRPRPTRVEAYDLRRRKKIGEWPTEAAGIDAIFSVLPAL